MTRARRSPVATRTPIRRCRRRCSCSSIPRIWRAELLEAQARRAAQAAGIEAEKARIASQKASLIGTAASLEQAKTDLERQTNDRGEMNQPGRIRAAQLKLEELQAQYNAAKRTA